MNEAAIIKLIFGLKIHQLRRDNSLSYQQLSDKTGLAISYLHNIEKGKKYPKADKIIALAKALGTNYNYLVSLEADKRLQPIIDLVQSDFLKLFPLDLFGISLTKLMELLVQAPDKVNAFISTVLKITRNYHLQGEDFYRAALRSFQDIQNNYFKDIEQAVQTFSATKKIAARIGFKPNELERLLMEEFGIVVNRELLHTKPELKEVRSFFVPKQRVLYINDNLEVASENFLLAKEIGFQVLKPEVRPLETRMIEVESFEKLLANFKASYFAVALLLQEDAMIQEVETMAQWQYWQADQFHDLLNKYHVSQEMLLQRFANILPRHFNIDNLFFLRFYTGPDLQKFKMTKEMHLSQLHSPHANQLDEHYCRRWISINLIRQLKAQQSIENYTGGLVGAQISNYWDTQKSYLCICMAKPEHNKPDFSVSFTIGLLIDDKLRRLFKFIDDPKLKVKQVHTTCERCPISDCGARAVPPIELQRQRSRKEIKQSLEQLHASVRV
ncbi:MAG: XRE family transcriptional regulator [Bacteroidota bacterium]